MSVELVKSVSDTLYEYNYPLELENPHDTREREELEDGIFDIFQLASIKDFKIIEHNWGYNVLFRLPHDHFHFEAALTQNGGDPIKIHFLPPPKDRNHIHGAHRLKKKFRNAARKAGAYDLQIAVSPQDKQVVVYAPNLAVYFDFWEKVPYTQRVKLGLE